MKRMAALAFALIAWPAAAVTLDDVVMSDQKRGTPKATFKPSTPKVFVVARVKDPSPGDKVKAEWIADKAEGAPPNYKIDQTELTLQKNSNEVTFSMSKPTQGWPVGAYHVDISVNGKPFRKIPFAVAK